MQFSFPKSERFPKSLYKSYCKRLVYDHPKNFYRSKRKAGIGLGQKYDFTKVGKGTPAPNKYQPRRSKSSVSVSFGLGRDVKYS